MKAPDAGQDGGEAAQQAAIKSGVPFVGRQPKESAVTGKAQSFDPAAFRNTESTGAIVGSRGEKKQGIEGKDVTFSAELTTQYERYLSDHIAKLAKMNGTVLDNDAHRYELRLVQALTTNNAPDATKITDFLKTPEGWSMATQVIEDQTVIKLFSLGLHVATQPRGRRVDQLEEDVVRLGLNQGLLSKLVMDKAWPWLDQRINITSGRPEERGIAGRLNELRRWQSIVGQAAGSLVGYALTGIYTGNEPAAIIAAAAVPGIMTIRNMFNSGVTMDFRRCAAALQSIQNDPIEMAYLKEMGIHPDNFVVAGDQITLRDRHGLPAMDVNKMKEEIFQGLYAREQFYTSLGIPYEQLDALPEQHLYQYVRGQAEQTGTYWQKKINDVFQPETTGIRDTAGNSPNNAAFLTGGATLDFEGNLRRFREARRRVLTDMMNDYTLKEVDKTLSTGAVTTITSKIAARRDEQGTERTARKKPMEDRKIALNNEKTGLTAEKTILDEHTAAKTALETEQKKFETEFEVAFLAGRNIEVELARVIDVLTNQANAGSIPARRDAIIGALNPRLIAAYAQADVDLNAQYGANPVPADVRTNMHNEYAQRVKNLYQADLDALREEENELKTQRTRLKEIRDSVKNAQRTVKEKNDRTVTSAKENLITTRADYTAITGWGIGAVSLQTMSVNEIMGQINAANVVNGANGWPEAQNNNPANRTRVINAIAEAKADYEESFDTQKPVRDIEYTALTGWGITADQLRTMSRQQLLVLINNANAANVLNGWPAAENVNPANIIRVNSAVEEARNRMILRHNAVLSTRLTDIDDQVKTQDKLIADINFDSEIVFLEAVKDLMGRQPKVFEIAYDVAADRARYTDINAVVATDATFTATEKAVFDGAVPPVGYWRIMNALFDYQTKTDRNTYAGKILKTLPPKALARRINAALGMAPGNPNFDNINVALSQMAIRIGGGGWTGIDVRGVFGDVINGLRAEADALS